jgi:hypothetical protein
MQEVRTDFPCGTRKFLLSWANFDQNQKLPADYLASGSLYNPGIAFFQIVDAV